MPVGGDGDLLANAGRSLNGDKPSQQDSTLRQYSQHPVQFSFSSTFQVLVLPVKPAR
jgi:hypothetical protein